MLDEIKEKIQYPVDFDERFFSQAAARRGPGALDKEPRRAPRRGAPHRRVKIRRHTTDAQRSFLK